MASPSSETESSETTISSPYSNVLHFFSGSGDKSIKIWNTATKQCVKTFNGHTGTVRSVRIHPNGAFLATGSFDNTIKIWNLASGTLLHTIDSSNGGHDKDVNVICFSKSGRWLASGSDDKEIRIFDFFSRSLKYTLKGHTARVRALGFNGDESRLISGAEDSTIRIWDFQNSTTPTATLTNHSKTIFALAMHPDGSHFVSGSADNTSKAWMLTSSGATMLKSFSHHTGDLNGAAFSPDGRYFATGSDDKTVKVYNWETKTLFKTLSGHGGYVWELYFLADSNHIVSTSSDKLIKKWNIHDGTHVDFSGHSETVYSVFAYHGTNSDVTFDIPKPKIIRLMEPDYSVAGYPAVDEERIVTCPFGDQFTCPICANVMIDVNPRATSITPCCANLYCTPCITQWVNSHSNCPSCRTVLKTDGLRGLNRYEKHILAGITLKCRYVKPVAIARQMYHDFASTGPQEIISKLRAGKISSDEAVTQLEAISKNQQLIKPLPSPRKNTSSPTPLEATTKTAEELEALQNAEEEAGDISPSSIASAPKITSISATPSAPIPLLKIPNSEDCICDYVGTLKDIIEHEKKCVWKPKPCDNEGCELVVYTIDFEDHKKNCAHRLVECPTAGCSETLKPGKLQDHLKECQWVIIDCPNSHKGCGCKQLRRSHLAVHLEQVCPMAINPCRHAAIGCKWRGINDEEEKHIEAECELERFKDFLYAQKKVSDNQLGIIEAQSKQIESLEAAFRKLQSQFGMKFLPDAPTTPTTPSVATPSSTTAPVKRVRRISISGS